MEKFFSEWCKIGGNKMSQKTNKTKHSEFLVALPPVHFIELVWSCAVSSVFIQTKLWQYQYAFLQTKQSLKLLDVTERILSLFRS